jgi:hypothetical protein
MTYDQHGIELLRRIAGPKHILLDERQINLAPNVDQQVLGPNDKRVGLVLGPSVQTYYVSFLGPATINSMQISLNTNPVTLLYKNIGDSIRGPLHAISPQGGLVTIWDLFG